MFGQRTRNLHQHSCFERKKIDAIKTSDWIFKVKKIADFNEEQAEKL
jgi:hypothetical protein